MDEKEGQTVLGLRDGVYKDAQGPQQKTSNTSLRIPTERTQGGLTPEQEKKVNHLIKEPHELQEEAWRLMSEAVTTGKMTLESGLEVHLNADSLIRIIQWLSSSKAKKPHLISTPEDYVLKQTTGGEK